MRDKIFLLSALLIVFFSFTFFVPEYAHVQNLPQGQKVSTASSSLTPQDVIYETARENLETSNITFNTLLTISLIILTILGVGVAIAALVTFDKIKEMNDKLAHISKKGLEADEIVEDIRKKAVKQESNEISPSGISQGDKSTLQPSTETSVPTFDSIKVDHFNKVYDLIFGTQILLLKQLFSNAPSYSMAKNQAFTLYENSPWNMPNFSFEQFMAFLKNNFLINENSADNIYVLTNLGADFLQFLIKERKEKIPEPIVTPK